MATDATARKRDFPCPWLALFGECAKGATGKCGPCEREASGVAAKPFPQGAVAQGAGDGATRAPTAPAPRDRGSDGRDDAGARAGGGRAQHAASGGAGYRGAQPRAARPPPEPPPAGERAEAGREATAVPCY
eukprot:1438769-Pleurochrysis_carterae.AAC.1